MRLLDPAFSPVVVIAPCEAGCLQTTEGCLVTASCAQQHYRLVNFWYTLGWASVREAGSFLGFCRIFLQDWSVNTGMGLAGWHLSQLKVVGLTVTTKAIDDKCQAFCFMGGCCLPAAHHWLKPATDLPGTCTTHCIHSNTAQLCC